MESTNDDADTNAFAVTAIMLLKEQNATLTKFHDELKATIKMGESRKEPPGEELQRKRILRFHHEFHDLGRVTDTLIRRSSQWQQHAKPLRPDVELELEIRLAMLEQLRNVIRRNIQENL